MVNAQIQIPKERIAAFCRQWKVRTFSLFGSILRDDFRPESDVDVLVTFGEGETWDLWDMIAMKGELEEIFHRPVDLVEKKALKNPFRRAAILREQEVIYGE